MKKQIKAMFLVYSLVILCVSVPVSAQSRQSDSLTKKVDEIFAKWDKTISPGCALAIIKDNTIIYSRGYGMANLDYGIPITPSSVFYVGSVSKQFTAACIALLALEDKLSLDDEIHQYFPEIPDYGTPIRIRHLIHHTSGLRDFWSLVGLSGQRFDNVYTNDDIFEIITRQKDINFKPGERYLYSNTNYLLMALIVKKVTGKSLREFADERIFKPLGMHHTFFNDDHTTIVKNRVYGYAPGKEGGFQMSIVNNDLVGQGGLWTTVEDLAKWDRNFYTAQVGGSAFIDQIHKRGKLNNGESLEYAYGLNVTEYKDERMVTHGGAMGGYRAVLTRFPERHFSVIILANLATMNPSDLALKVADLYLFEGIEETTAKKKVDTTPSVTFTSRELQNLIGLYYEPYNGILKITESNGTLYAKGFGWQFQIVPQSSTQFHSADIPVNFDFVFSQENNKTHVQMTINDQNPRSLTKIKIVSPSSKVLPLYAGDYYSEELQTTYNIAVEDEKLYFSHRNAPESFFEPMRKDEFHAGNWIIEFTRDKREHISGFILNADRVRNIRFVRQ